ncbi:MAG: hypothetical protein QOF84_1709 [Streptomyces sp.]|jgi:hypothetical protein|nr:hypothetical protein [Streptomyces sp.]
MTENQVETPVVEGYGAALEALRHAPYGGGEHADAGAEAGRELAVWERAVRRIEAGKDLTREGYREGLAARDRIPGYAHGLGAPVGALFREALGEVDGVFMRLTVEDEAWLAEAEAEAGHEHAHGHGWWWHRRPRAVPWEG